MTCRDDHIDVMREFAKAETGREMDPHWAYGRRAFLRSSVAAAIAMPFGILGSGQARAVQLPYSPDYGSLTPVADEATGLPLLQLPAGFKYWSFGWTGDAMSDGIPTPGKHDGMAVCASDNNRLVLVRNHEQYSCSAAGTFAPSKITYDPRCDGGTTNLVFAPRDSKWRSSWATLSGTLRNCAGGPTPWNSWITCEETSAGPANGARKQHGYCFDVPAAGPAKPVPLVAMGCFRHEAIAVDPVTGHIYETEHSTPGGFYRFIPSSVGRPGLGGKLKMMKLKTLNNTTHIYLGTTYDFFDTGAGVARGTAWDVEWVDIAKPNKPFVTGTSYGGVVTQGLAQGASSIRDGEGCWYGNGVIYVCSTSGGAHGKGQIFAYDPRRETFTLVFESGGDSDVTNPDNIAWSPRGSLILCEDGGDRPQALRGLTLDGTIFPFCYNNVDFTATGPITRPSGLVFRGDQRTSEFAGSTFHNEWLFVNIQSPGITFAITGPWDDGAL